MTNINIGGVLHQLMGGMSESALAKAVDLPKATIHRVLAGLTPDPRAGTLLPIAKYFNITIEQLMGITPLPNNTPLQVIENKNAIDMPFIHFNKLGEWIKGIYKPDKYYNISSFSNNTIDINCFITKLNTEEMTPLFSNNTFLIIKKQKSVENENIVLVYNFSNDNFMVRKCMQLGGVKYLMSSNPSYDIIEFSQTIELIGVVIEGRIVI